MDTIKTSVRRFNQVLCKNIDPRTADLPLMSNPFLIIVFSLLYVFFVKSLGPALMKNRKPFELRSILLVYNSLQVFFSSWLVYRFLIDGWLTGEYSFLCQPIDSSSNSNMAKTAYWFYISKYTEFVDTIFFVLRKKNNQITTLHIYHHGIMPFSCWIAAAYSPGGQITFVGLLNSSVHAVMYTYYMLSAFGPAVQKYLWWKKYITSLQMVQFIVIAIHSLQPLFVGCPYPKIISIWVSAQSAIFLILFKQFFSQTYKKGYHQGAEVQKEANGVNGIVKAKAH